MKIGNYEVVQIDSQSWRIEGGIVRAFLFTGTQRALLVDTTETPGELDAVVRELTALPVTLVNTHADGDHISCNDRFPTAYMHPAEFAQYAKASQPGFAKPASVQDGELIDLGGRVFEVILIPGHTCGSIALLDKAGKVLVGGDTISAGPVFMFGDTRNIDAFCHSLERLQARSPEFDTIYPSHGVFPLEVGQIANQLACAKKLMAGELEPQEPPYPLPAKMFSDGKAAFFYIP